MFKKILIIIIYLLVCSCSSCDSNPMEYPSIPDTGNHPTNSLWFVPNSDGTWGIGYNSNVEIGGFQITISGSTIISVISGDAQNYGFTITENESSGIILGFSFSGVTIPIGSGILFSLELDGIPTAITNIIISDDSANSVFFTFYSTYFSTNLELSGISKLTIFSSSITTLQLGDEISIFDSNRIFNYDDCTNQIGGPLVGNGVWQGDQLDIISIGSVDYFDIGEVEPSDYVISNPIIIKVWDSSKQIPKVGSLEYLSGGGIFSDISTSVSELIF